MENFGNLVGNLKPSRFRVGGKVEKRLNKTEVKEILSEHFAAKVKKFLRASN